jgi:hypothetical protein
MTTKNERNADAKDSNKPDFELHLVVPRDRGKPDWFKVGAVWKGSKGYSGRSAWGEIVLLPPKEDIDETK